MSRMHAITWVITVDLNLDNLAEAVFVRLFHCKVTHSFPLFMQNFLEKSLSAQLRLHSPWFPTLLYTPAYLQWVSSLHVSELGCPETCQLLLVSPVHLLLHWLPYTSSTCISLFQTKASACWLTHRKRTDRVNSWTSSEKESGTQYLLHFSFLHLSTNTAHLVLIMHSHNCSLC